NAHVIIEQAPAEETAQTDEPTATPLPVIPWLVSARGEDALRGQAARLHGYVTEHPELDPADIGWSLATTRALLDERAVITGSDRAELLADLASLAEGRPASAVVRANGGRRGRTAFLLTGQGSQRLGMGRELYETSPVFAAAFDEVCARLDGELMRPLRQVVFAREDSADAALIDQTVFTQAALFTVEVALFRLAEHHGIRPDFLLGHSIGEVTAAHLAGVLDLDDACVLVAERGRLMQAAREGGAMAAIQASEEEIRTDLAGHGDAVAIAGINGPASTVISGDTDAVERIAASWKDRDRKTKLLPVSHAFHSPHMEEVLEEFRTVASGLTFREPRIPIVSNVTGALATAEQLASPGYWAQHIREAVRFLDGVRTLEAEGVTHWLELGPDGVLSALVEDCLAQDATVLTPALRRGRSEGHTFAAALGHFAVSGAPVDWSAVFPGARTTPLPGYAFQHARYWLDGPAAAGDAAGLGLVGADHPLLGAAVALAHRDEYVLTGRLSRHSHPWLTDHVVADLVLVPGTGILELAVRAADEVGAEQVEELTLTAPLVLPERGSVQIQLAVGAADPAGRRTLEIHSRPVGEDLGSEQPWVLHAHGTLGSAGGAGVPGGLLEWPPAGAE
ncbi:acyltransferase domain-containing protein, partial [Streptomyces sp. NPDC059176]|uniref:acyltransferase domain-containing protein n=1 Tax=unclassified Streptomyces TaxID=2593676 RepID=UPI00369E0D84